MKFDVDFIFEGLLGMLQVLSNLDNVNNLGKDYASLMPLLEGMKYSKESLWELNRASGELLRCDPFIPQFMNYKFYLCWDYQ